MNAPNRLVRTKVAQTVLVAGGALATTCLIASAASPPAARNLCDIVASSSKSGIVRAYTDAPLPSVADIVRRRFGGAIALPRDASDIAARAPLTASVETLGQHGYLVRYTTRGNCSHDRDRQYARISARRMPVFDALTGSDAVVPSIGRVRFAGGALPAVAFERGGVRYSIALARVSRPQLLSIAARLLAVDAPLVQYAMPVASTPMPARATPSPSPTPTPTPTPTATPTGARALAPVPRRTPIPAPRPPSTPKAVPFATSRALPPVAIAGAPSGATTPPDIIRFIDFHPHAAAAGATVAVTSANGGLETLRCVLLGDVPAAFKVVSPKEADIIVPRDPRSGGLMLVAANSSISTGGFIARPPTARGNSSQSRAATFAATYSDRDGVLLPHVEHVAPLLRAVVDRLRSVTSAPLIVPAEIAGARRADVASVTGNGYDVVFFNAAHSRIAELRVVREWLYAGPAYEALNPRFGAHRQLANGVPAGYTPYTCEAVCTEAQLAFGYAGSLVTLRSPGAWASSLLSMADSAQVFR